MRAGILFSIFLLLAVFSVQVTGNEISRKIYIKNSPSVQLKTSGLQTNNGTGSWRPPGNDNSPWLELSWSDYRKPLRLLIKQGEKAVKNCTISYWDDKPQTWSAAESYELSPQAEKDYT